MVIKNHDICYRVFFFRELKEIEIELGIVVEYDMKLLMFT